jgi:hypothetical protein
MIATFTMDLVQVTEVIRSSKQKAASAANNPSYRLALPICASSSRLDKI